MIKTLFLLLSSLFLLPNAQAQLKVLWQETAGGDYMDAIVRIFELENQELLALGYRNPGGKDKSNYWLLRFDANGKLLKEKQLLGSDAEYLIDAVSHEDATLTLLGAVVSGQEQYVELLSITTKGELLWNSKIQTQRTFILNDFVATSDKGFLLAGQIEENGDLETWLIKTDAKGQQLWEKEYGDRLNDGAQTICEMPDGHFLIGGFVERQDRKSDLQLIKVTPNGNMLWRKRFSRAQGASALLCMRDSTVLVGGYTYGKTPANRDVYLLAVDADGTPLWEKRIGRKAPSREDVDALLELPSGDIMLSMGGPLPDNDLQATRLMGIDSSGRELWSQYLAPKRRLYAKHLCLRKDSSLLLCGSDASPQGPRIDGYLTAFSLLERPRLLWAQTYADTAKNTAADVLPYRDGYLLLGQNYSTDAHPPIQLLYSDAEGQEKWRKLFGTENTEEPLQLLPSKGSEFFLLSKATSGTRNVYLRKLNRRGEELWKKRYGLEGSLSEDVEAIVHENGMLLMTTDAGVDDSVLALRLINAEGKELWRKTFKNRKGGKAQSICQTADGNYWLLGYQVAAEGAQWPWLLAVDGQGELLWERELVDLKSLRPMHIEAWADSGAVLVGNHLDSPIAKTLREDAAVELVRFDAKGEPLWRKSYVDKMQGQPQTLYTRNGESWLLINENEAVVLYKLDVQGKVTDQQDWSVWGLDYGHRLIPHNKEGLLLFGLHYVDKVRQMDMRLLRLR